MTRILISLFLATISVNALSEVQNLRSPNVSANALFLYRNSNYSKLPTSTERNGIDLQEAELSFYADVDPYSRLNLLLAIRPEYEVNTDNDNVEQSFAIEPEVLYR